MLVVSAENSASPLRAAAGEHLVVRLLDSSFSSRPAISEKSFRHYFIRYMLEIARFNNTFAALEPWREQVGTNHQISSVIRNREAT
jgi:hypothetical protein